MTNKYLLSLNTGASYELGGETPNAYFSPASGMATAPTICAAGYGGTKNMEE